MGPTLELLAHNFWKWDPIICIKQNKQTNKTLLSDSSASKLVPEQVLAHSSIKGILFPYSFYTNR